MDGGETVAPSRGRAALDNPRGDSVAIPDYQAIMLPMLKLLADGRIWSRAGAHL
jgi:hypothetical protein